MAVWKFLLRWSSIRKFVMMITIPELNLLLRCGLCLFRCCCCCWNRLSGKIRRCPKSRGSCLRDPALIAPFPQRKLVDSRRTESALSQTSWGRPFYSVCACRSQTLTTRLSSFTSYNRPASFWKSRWCLLLCPDSADRPLRVAFSIRRSCRLLLQFLFLSRAWPASSSSSCEAPFPEVWGPVSQARIGWKCCRSSSDLQEKLSPITNLEMSPYTSISLWYHPKSRLHG